MNKVTPSLLAAVFALAVSTSFASTHQRADVEDALTQTVLVQTLSLDNVVVMRAEATLPDGGKARAKNQASNMAMALIAYQNFIRTLPHGATLNRVTFTDGNGNILFSAEG